MSLYFTKHKKVLINKANPRECQMGKKRRTHRSYEECVKMYSKGLKGRQHVGDLDVSRRIIKFLVTIYRLMTIERSTRKKNCL
jgi:hypothetical protein